MENLKEYWPLLGPIMYEILARVIPTVKDYTILGKVIKAIKWFHDELNNVKPKTRK
jgi:hypothetical protein